MALRIVLVASPGGHLTQMQALLPAFENHELRWVTCSNPRTNSVLPQAWKVSEPGRNALRYLFLFGRAWRWLRRVRPDVLVTTGSEIAIPFLFASRFLGIHIIYVDSLTRVTSKSMTGRVAYRVAQEFYVQWPAMCNVYGPRARFIGGLL